MTTSRVPDAGCRMTTSLEQTHPSGRNSPGKAWALEQPPQPPEQPPQPPARPTPSTHSCAPGRQVLKEVDILQSEAEADIAEINAQVPPSGVGGWVWREAGGVGGSREIAPRAGGI